MDEDVWREKSQLIVDHLEESSVFKQAERIHSYISMNQRNEVNTHFLIRELLEEGKEVIVPVTNFEDGMLSHVQLHDFDELQPNKWGLLEPPVTDTVEARSFDIILIPMAAADIKGNRLGYGKGFYDRFLSGCKGTKIGLLFHRFIQEEIPSEDFDVKMDMLISEKGVIHT